MTDRAHLKAIASELAISLRRRSNIDNWHAECDITTSAFVDLEKKHVIRKEQMTVLS